MAAYCPGGHKLVEAKNSEGDGRKRKNKKMQCDSCQKIALAQEFAGCRPCNYDICSSCLKKMRTETAVDIKELLGDTFYNQEKKKVGPESLSGKKILIYFWSHTCEICDTFSNALAGYYSEAKEKGSCIEVVAVTDTADDADEEEKEMWEAFKKHGNWLALPFDDESGRHRLHDWAGELLGDSPSGCGPSLLVIDEKGIVINKRALLTVGSGTNHIMEASWESPTVGDLSCGPYANNSDIAMSRALVVLAEDCSVNVKKRLKETLTEVSEELKKQQNPPLLFLGTKNGPCKGIRKDVFKALSNGCETWGRGWTSRAIRKWSSGADKRCAEPDARPLMMMIDVSEFTDSERQGFYLSNATLVTIDKIKSFIKQVEDEELELQKFDFSQYDETFEPIEEEVNRVDPKYQPLTGSVTADGCYMGAGTWDDFGVEGIGGKITMSGGDADDDSAAASSSDDEPSPTDKAFSFVQQYREGDSKKDQKKTSQPQNTNEITLSDRVLRLESLVDKQQHVIDHLLSRLNTLEGKGNTKGKVYFNLDEQLRQQYREEHEDELKNEEDKKEHQSKQSYLCEDDADTDSDDSEVRAYRNKKASQSSTPSQSQPSGETYKCEDDEATDSSDSEVRAYRAKKAAHANKPLASREYKCEDDDDTESDDSEVRAYRAKKASQQLQPASNECEDDQSGDAEHEYQAMKAGKANLQSSEYKCEDDDDTDSEDSEVREYRAKKAAQSAASNTKPTEKQPEHEVKEDKSDTKPTETSEVKKEEDSTPKPSNAISKDEDWICPKCRGFNWGGTTDCAHCP